MAVLMVWSVSSDPPTSLLLLVYWSLSLPALGQDIAILARQYPVLRNVVLRLHRAARCARARRGPPGRARPAPAAPARSSDPTRGDPRRRVEGVAIRLSGVSVEAAGNTVLEEVDLEIAPGEHVAIVGPSGAGKSSLVGLLLGWYRPARGTVEVDARPLTGDWLRALRRDTAWVDPEVRCGTARSWTTCATARTRPARVCCRRSCPRRGSARCSSACRTAWAPSSVRAAPWSRVARASACAWAGRWHASGLASSSSTRRFAASICRPGESSWPWRGSGGATRPCCG